MSKRWQNGFFLFGLAVLAVMITQLDFSSTWSGLQRAGYWAVAVVVLWAFLYILNTAALRLIIHAQPSPDATGHAPRMGFWWLYKLTVSGFALNYATPGGLMGGEPYKILMLKERIGTERATASVILHTMTHIFSHFWFWLASVVLYVLTEPMTDVMWVLLPVVTLFCVGCIWFFLKGYKKGITVWTMQLLKHVPLAARWVEPFLRRKAEKLAMIDRNIAALHNQNRRTFVLAVFLEWLCRMASAMEVWFVLLVVMPSATYFQSVLILAFTSLFANMLFFIPLQLGGREGGFLMSVESLGMTVSAGIFLALIVRVRELVWTGIGLLLIKMNKKSTTES